jgi:hypothetical protein
MNKAALEKRDQIVRLCKEFNVEKLDVIDERESARWGPEKTAIDFYVTFKEMSESEHAHAYLDLMVALADLWPDRHVFLGLHRTPGDPYFKREEIRELVYGA